MNRRSSPIPALLAVITISILAHPLGVDAGNSEDMAVKFILETVKAFRIVYSKGVIEEARKSGIQPSENWKTDNHSIMLNAQFVKAAGAEIKEFELGLIGLTPLYKYNLPQTKAETDALKKMEQNPELKVLTFVDGNQFKGLAADYAIVQGCADCHNTHPNSTRKNFRQGDLMGAIVVRINRN